MALLGLKEGLPDSDEDKPALEETGYQEVTQSGTYFNSTFSGTTIVNEDLDVTGDIDSEGNIALAGSQNGIVLQYPASTIITGGQWAVGVSGTTATVATAAVSDTKVLGIATETVVSGGTAHILVQGVYAMIAEGTVAIGDSLAPGSAAGINTVVPTGSATVPSNHQRAIALNTAASGTSNVALVLL